MSEVVCSVALHILRHGESNKESHPAVLGQTASSAGLGARPILAILYNCGLAHQGECILCFCLVPHARGFGLSLSAGGEMELG